MRTKIFRLIHQVFFFIVSLNCLSPLAHAADESSLVDEFRLGAILILTGEGASWGTASRNGIEMAVEKINSQGGVLGKKLVVEHQDDQGDPTTSVSAFRELTDISGVKFIIGPSWSRLGIPLIEMAERKQILMISPSVGMAKFNESSEFLFNTWPHDALTSAKLADHVYARGKRSVALIGAEEPWVKEQTEAFKHRFEELGGKIALLIEPNPKDTDVRTHALKIAKAEGIDAVVSTTDGVLIGSLVAKALKELSVKLPIYCRSHQVKRLSILKDILSILDRELPIRSKTFVSLPPSGKALLK